MSCWKKQKVLLRLYNIGEKKVNSSLNVFNILMKLNELVLIVNHYQLKNNVNNWIFRHSCCNVIDCDETKDLNCDEETEMRTLSLNV